MMYGGNLIMPKSKPNKNRHSYKCMACPDCRVTLSKKICLNKMCKSYLKEYQYEKMQ